MHVASLSGRDKALHWKAETPNWWSENIAEGSEGVWHLSERTQLIVAKAMLGELQVLRCSLDSWEDGWVFFVLPSPPPQRN